MSESHPGQGAAVVDTATDDKEVTECPTCGEDDFANAAAMKSHHKQAHGECIAGVATQCDHCDDSIRVSYHRYENSDSNYCGVECRSKDGRKRIEYNCEWCGVLSEQPPSIYSASEHHFCSPDCHADWMEEHQTGDNCPSWDPSAYEIKQCEVCDDDIRVKKTSASPGRFCSKECMAVWQRENFSGPNHPCWNGGGGPDYYGTGWREIREEIIERDGRTCQGCKTHESDLDLSLEVHHIHPIDEFDDKDRANKRLNLVTFCRSCHAKWEGWYVRPDPRE